MTSPSSLFPLGDQELPDVPDVATLVRRYAPDVRPALGIDRVSAWFSLAMLALFVGIGGHGLAGWIAGVIAGVLVMAVGIGFFERDRSRRLAEFERAMDERPWEFYGAVADRFRRDLEGQRIRLTGPRSEWGRARAPLEDALREARRSQAYWEERAAQDPGQPILREHALTAGSLAGKFQSAAEELDARSRILFDFFDRCEAKLAVLEHSGRDVEESRRLARLSDRAAGVAHDAEAAIAGIAGDVLRQAVQVGRALGAMERLRIQHSAGELPVDEIEAVADRIIASADEERRALEDLVSSVGADPD